MTFAFGTPTGPPHALSMPLAWAGTPIGAIRRLQMPAIPLEGVPPFTLYRFEPTGPSLSLLAASTRDALLSYLTALLSQRTHP